MCTQVHQLLIMQQCYNVGWGAGLLTPFPPPPTKKVLAGFASMYTYIDLHLQYYCTQ